MHLLNLQTHHIADDGNPDTPTTHPELPFSTQLKSAAEGPS